MNDERMWNLYIVGFELKFSWRFYPIRRWLNLAAWLKFQTTEKWYFFSLFHSLSLILTASPVVLFSAVQSYTISFYLETGFSSYFYTYTHTLHLYAATKTISISFKLIDIYVNKNDSWLFVHVVIPFDSFFSFIIVVRVVVVVALDVRLSYCSVIQHFAVQYLLLLLRLLFPFFFFSVHFHRKLFFPLTFRCCLQPYKLLDVRMLVCIYALILYIQPISNYNSIGGNDQHTEPTTTTTTITVHLILFDRIRIRIVSWKCMTKIVGAGDFDIRERSRIKIRYAVWK